MNREPILYLHGLPGSMVAEMVIAFGERPAPSEIVNLDRLVWLRSGADYQSALLECFDEQFARSGSTKVRLAAFSLGAMPALHIAAARPECISSIDLFAPAAPLQLGDFLPIMAGRPVFEAASASRFRLWTLTRIQSLGFNLAPNFVFRQIFSTAPQTEKSLMEEPSCTAAFLDGARYAIRDNPAPYRKELKKYVENWSAVLPNVRVPVRIWQGTADNWVPPEMTQALASAIAGPVEIEWLEGLSHYGSLKRALPQI